MFIQFVEDVVGTASSTRSEMLAAWSEWGLLTGLLRWFEW